MWLLNFGPLLNDAQKVATKHHYALTDMRWVKPLDRQIILSNYHRYDLLVTLEEGCLKGGAGSAVAELLAEHGATKPILSLGIPDRFIEHASRKQQLQSLELDAAGIERQINRRLAEGDPVGATKVS